METENIPHRMLLEGCGARLAGLTALESLRPRSPFPGGGGAGQVVRRLDQPAAGVVEEWRIDDGTPSRR